MQSHQRHLQVVYTVRGRSLPRHLFAPFDPDDVKAQSRQLVRIAGVQTFNDVMVPGVTACQHALYLPTSNNTSSAMNSTNNLQQHISSATNSTNNLQLHISSAMSSTTSNNTSLATMDSTNNLQQHISGNNGQYKQPFVVYIKQYITSTMDSTSNQNNIKQYITSTMDSTSNQNIKQYITSTMDSKSNQNNIKQYITSTMDSTSNRKQLTTTCHLLI